MPDYDFVCHDCGSAFSLHYKSFSAYSATSEHLCRHCNSGRTSRRIGRVALGKGAARRLDELASDTSIDENDPRAMEGFIKRLGEELDSDVSRSDTG